ncbi:MAG: CRISPR-associated helicase Cas3' [Desulfurococcaceae archaeon]
MTRVQRRGVRRLLEVLEEHEGAIFVAPTGYGKTVASPSILRKELDRGRSAGLVHVVPLKALVRKIFEEKFSGLGLVAGYQSEDPFDLDNKSPFFMRELVVTTLDSFVMNLYKIPVAEFRKVVGERSAGHYFTPLANVLTSTVVFDEAHIYAGGLDESISLPMVYAAIGHLSSMGVPVVVETATMHTQVIERVSRLLSGSSGKAVPTIYVGCGGANEQIKRLRDLEKRRIVELEEVVDDEFCRNNDFAWTTEFIGEGELVERAAKSAEEGAVVLVVRNTVAKAVRTYEELRRRLGGGVVLVHGKLSHRDRDEAMKAMDRVARGGGVIVATQVVEAGVETNASILFTDAAPIEDLAQRAGRLCREGSKSYELCKEGRGAAVYIVRGGELVEGKYDGIYDAERVEGAVKKVEEVVRAGADKLEWRLLDHPSRTSFAKILEELRGPRIDWARPGEESIFSKYLGNPDADYGILKEILRELDRALFRETVRLRLAIAPEDVGRGARLAAPLDTMDVEAEWFLEREYEELRRGGGCLAYDERGRAIILRISRREGGELELELAPSRGLTKDRLRPYGLGRRVADVEWLVNVYSPAEGDGDYEYLLLLDRCYERGLGITLAYKR